MPSRIAEALAGEAPRFHCVAVWRDAAAGRLDGLKDAKMAPNGSRPGAGLKLKESGRTFIIPPERERSNAERDEPATGREGRGGISEYRQTKATP